MTQDTKLQSQYRGVLCGFCRQPIPVPGLVEKIATGENAAADPRGCTFNLRCRACEREKPYRMSEISEFEGAPRLRSARSATFPLKQQHLRARTANG
jgi:hypothetical protein